MDRLLFFTVFRNVKKSKETHPEQRSVQIYLLCLKVKVSQSFKSSSYKKLFLHCVWHLYNLLRWMFLISLDDWKAFLFVNVCCCLEVFLNQHVVAFFEKSILRDVRILHYLHNNSTILMPMFQNKATVVYHIC